MKELSHINSKGKATMVDIGDKPDQIRVARASGFIQLRSDTLSLIKANKIQKGDVFTLAEIAGIQAAKDTSRLIPLCHNLNITKVDVEAKITDSGVQINSMVKCFGKTGVEMEALTAVNIALLTIYDMCKAVDKQMVLMDIKLDSKEKI